MIYAAFLLSFRDGTTDVTRTYHFGTPSAFERESFTMVLKVTNFASISRSCRHSMVLVVTSPTWSS